MTSRYTRSALAVLAAGLALAGCETRVRPLDDGIALAACVNCHGDRDRAATDPLVRAAPPSSPTSKGAGAHLAHLVAGTFRAPLACSECHYVPLLGAHADGTAAVAMTGLGAADDAAPAWDAASATCSGVYCHGATRGGGPAATPAWSATDVLGCASCHGAPPPPPHSTSASCGACHPGYTATSVDLATHADGRVQTSGGHAAGFSDPAVHGPQANRDGLGTCKSCHGPDLTSCTGCHGDHGFADWATRCTFCHGTAGGLASPPVDTQGRDAEANVSVGAHAAHVSTALMETPLACTECHPDRAGSNVVTDAQHVDGDGQAEVSFGTLAGAGATYTRVSDTSATCSSTWCHGASTVEWTDTTNLGCSSCHGAPPGGSHDPSTTCGGCHAGYTPTSVNPATHLDGSKQSSSGHADGYRSSAVHGYEVNRVGLASCKGCHGPELAKCDGCHGGTAWQTSCTFCHGTPGGAASPPVDTQGRSLTTNVSVGAHAAHVSTALTSTPIGCADCHPDRSGSNVRTDGQHVDGDGIAEVQLGSRAGAGAVYDRESGTSATCASTYCHGAATVQWTDSAGLGCGSCHGAPPAWPHAPSDACGDCHDGYTKTSVNPALHLDGKEDADSPHVDLYENPAVHGYEVNRTGLADCKTCHGPELASCNACHDNSTAWQTTCTFCHGTPGGAASPPVDTQGRSLTANVSVGAHAAHLSTSLTATAIGCADCHPDRSGSNVRTDGLHVDGDGIAEVELGARAGAGATYTRVSATSATCASTYCHGASTPQWTDTADLGCTSCHASPPASWHTTATTCGDCHAGYTQSSVDPATHLDGAVQATSPHPTDYGVSSVHGYEVNRIGLATCKTCHTPELTSCTECHTASGFADWATRCTFCHGTPGGSAAPPVDTQGGSATANVSVGLHASHVGTTIATPLACTECHPDRSASNVVTDAAHIDGTATPYAEVVFGPLAGATAAYTRTSGTAASCASTYCHGKFTGGTSATVSWTSTIAASCTSCHGNSPNTGRHASHKSPQGEGVFPITCHNCHNSVVTPTSNGIADPPLHVNGAKEVKFGGTHRIDNGDGTFSDLSVSGTWNPSTRSCSSLTGGCHGTKNW